MLAFMARAGGELASDVDARARVEASLEIERRSIATTFVIVILAFLNMLAQRQSASDALAFDLALVTTAPAAVARLALLKLATRRPPGSPERARLAFAPLLVLVAAWGLFAAWGAVAAAGTQLATLVLATQCLCGAAVVISYGAALRLATAIVVATIVPPAVALAVAGTGADHSAGLGGLLYCAMLVTYLPRVARERRAALATVLLLRQRALSLEAARDVALTAAAAKEAFFANLSHEIRTPLHGVLGTVARLQTTPLAQAERTALDQLESSGRTLLATLNDALDSARLESGQLRLHLERFSVPALLDDVVALFRDQAARKGVAVRLVTDDVAGGGAGAGLCEHVVGDAARVRQVLHNLVGNAVKFTRAGEVIVRARTEPSGPATITLAVDVVDTGVGFDASERGRLFERFSQLREGTRSSGGTGLGLAISKDLVRLMKGEIEASSAGPGSGATFSVKIPLALDQGGPGTSVEGRRVLVVDDNPVNLAVARGFLEALGVAVAEAASGAAALSRAGSASYDAILMDLRMPDKDGFETTRDLRARGDDTPVLAITASCDESTYQQCKDAGIDGLVEKPVSIDTLRDALTPLLLATRENAAAAGAASNAAAAP